MMALFTGLLYMRKGIKQGASYKKSHMHSFTLHLFFLGQYLVLQIVNTILLSLNFWGEDDSDEFLFFLSIAGENLTQLLNFLFMLFIAGKLNKSY